MHSVQRPPFLTLAAAGGGGGGDGVGGGGGGGDGAADRLERSKLSFFFTSVSKSVFFDSIPALVCFLWFTVV
jgi:hypothetical protein